MINEKDNSEDGICCMNVIQHAIDMMTEFNESPEERGECRICLVSFAETKLLLQASDNKNLKKSRNMQLVTNCLSCNAMFHGKCLAQYWWRVNIRKVMHSFSGSNSTIRDFYFEIGQDLRQRQSEKKAADMQVEHTSKQCKVSALNLKNAEDEQKDILNNKSGTTLSAVTKQRLFQLKKIVQSQQSKVQQYRAQRKEARQRQSDSRWRLEQLEKDMADLVKAVTELEGWISSGQGTLA